jgi:fluoroquinolone resistance protein
VADRRHGTPPPGTVSSVRSEDWDARDISAERQERVAFLDVDLTEAVNGGAVFTECTFTSCEFNASRHTDAAFLNCTFTRCTFFDAAFIRCKLVGSMFDRCTFRLTTIEGGDWSFVGLPGADLGGATVRGVRMREVDLTGARLAGGVFRDVDASGAWWHRADLTGADLRGTDLSSLEPATAQLRGAKVDLRQAVVVAGNLGLDIRPDDDPPG